MRAGLSYVLLIAASVAPAQNTNQPQGPPVAASVKMSGSRFLPVRVTIRAGETVEWLNQSSEPHTITVDPAKALDLNHVALPPNVAPFGSGAIPAGNSFRYTFKVPGTYRYFCIVHEGQGMVGVIEVQPK
jgi:plastocyanin